MSRKKATQKLTKLFDITWSLFIKMHKVQENKGKTHMNIPKIGKIDALAKMCTLLPPPFDALLSGALKTALDGIDEVYELHLRAEGRTSIVTDKGARRVDIYLTYKDISDILLHLSGGAIYAHRDTLERGYISAEGGTRVGVAGRARYEGGELVGVYDVRTLVFRIKGAVCDTEYELFDFWQSNVRRGMLVFSPPGGGKTTAIRRLAGRIGESGKQVAVVDERCEFLAEDYKNAEVELLRGYKKSEGIEIAVRTLGAEVLIVDEIGAHEAAAVFSSMMLGVPIIATVHAKSDTEILRRDAFLPIIRSGAFDALAGLYKDGARRSVRFTMIDKSLTGG